MGREYSDSENDDYHRKKVKKVRRKPRSRSCSRDRSRHSKQSKHSRRHSRSDSEPSQKQSHRYRQSCSHSSERGSTIRDGRNWRSRSRSRSRSDHDSRRSSKSRESSHRSHESHHLRRSKSSKGPSRHLELAEKQVQKAFQATVTADDILRAQGIDDGGGSIKTTMVRQTSQLTFEEQQKRASIIQDIDSGDFVQQTFKSNRNEIPLPSGSSLDAFHSGAMFSSSNALLPMHAIPTTSLYHSHSDSVMHPNLYVGVEEKMETWKRKVVQLRRSKLSVGIEVY